MSQTYSGWRNERINLFSNVNDVLIAILGVSALPMVVFMANQRWQALGTYAAAWVLLVVLTVIPVKERPAWVWMAHLTGTTIGKLSGVMSWQSAATTEPLSKEDAGKLDLPGPLQKFEVFDGPPYAHSEMRRVVVLKDPAGAWTVVAKVAHPGLSLTDPDGGPRWAAALGDLLAAVARSTSLPSRVSIYVRTVPDDGADRAQWLAQHSSTKGIPAEVIRDTNRVEASVLSQSVSHEVYVAARFREDDIAGEANSSGRGFAGRAAVIYRALPELTDQLVGAGADQVTWLDKGELASAIRTGFNPDAVQGVQSARAAQRGGADVNAEVSPAAAGPAFAPAPTAKAYTHDAFRSVAYSIVLPELGTSVGSLGPLLTPGVMGERRALALHYEPLNDKAAAKEAESASTNAFLAQEFRARRGFKVSERSKRLSKKTGNQEKVLAAGHTLTRVTGVAVVTAPIDKSIETHTALLEASARKRKFELMRLDLAQPLGFIAGCLPVGLGMPNQRKRK